MKHCCVVTARTLNNKIWGCRDKPTKYKRCWVYWNLVPNSKFWILAHFPILVMTTLMLVLVSHFDYWWGFLKLGNMIYLHAGWRHMCCNGLDLLGWDFHVCLWINVAPGRKDKVWWRLFVMEYFKMKLRPSLGFSLALTGSQIDQIKFFSNPLLIIIS